MNRHDLPRRPPRGDATCVLRPVLCAQSWTRVARAAARLLGALLVCGAACVQPVASAAAAPEPPPCAALQAALLALPAGARLVLDAPRACGTQPDLRYRGSKFDAVLLVPEGITLDLGGHELALHARGNSTYGVRLARGATLRNGRVRVASSSGIESTTPIWHSAISLGAAYGTAGSVAAPDYFAELGGWRLLDLVVTQPFPRSAIQLIGAVHDGLIENVTIADSAQAMVGIGLDWGFVGEPDPSAGDFRALQAAWRAGRFLTTHPHDIDIRHIVVGRLARDDDDDRAALRTSAVHAVKIRDVTVDEAGAGIVFRGGDLGYEFARAGVRELAHTGLVLEDFRIRRALRNGLIVEGYADNVDRAHEADGYPWLLDPRQGLVRPRISRGVVQGASARRARVGVVVKNVDGLVLEDVAVDGFRRGLVVERDARNVTLRRATFLRGARRGIEIQGVARPGSVATELAILPERGGP